MGAAKAHQRAEAMVVARVPRNRCQSGGQNLAEAVLTIDGGTRSRKVQKGLCNMRTHKTTKKLPVAQGEIVKYEQDGMPQLEV